MKTRKQQQKNVFDMLLEEIISKSNMHRAYERVVADKGAAGIDGIGFMDFGLKVRAKWPSIKCQLEMGAYHPQAVKRVKIPKAMAAGSMVTFNKKIFGR